MNARGWTIAILVVAVMAATGCGKGGASSDFQKQRERIVKQERKASPPRTAKAPAAATRPGAAGATQAGTGTAEGAAPGLAAQTTPAPVAVAAYRYDPLGKKDPFRSFVLDRLKEVDVTTKGPLEQFELQQLDVLGVVWETDNRRALVADPSGQAYIVSEGDAIGKNDGQILSIDDNLMLVRETYVDYVGDRTTKEIEMRVRQGQGG